jgi:hypothetical protein
MTKYGRRRRRVLLGALLTLFLAVTAYAAPRHLLDDTDRTYLSTDAWPRRGQGAYVLGNGRPAATAGRRRARTSSRSRSPAWQRS